MTSLPRAGVAIRQCKKNFEDIFIRFDVIHERDGQTDGQTLRDSKDRACIASRGKNDVKLFYKIKVSKVWIAEIAKYKYNLKSYSNELI